MSGSWLLGALAAFLALAALVLLHMLRHVRAHAARLQVQRVELMERLGEGQSRRAAAEAESAARLAALAESGAAGRALLDALPFLVWRRGGDLKLAAVNRVYAEAVDADPARAVSLGLELAGEDSRALATNARDRGATQSVDRNVVMAGTRKILQLTETPLNGGFLGYARDLTETEGARAELARHIAAHAAVLENVAVAVAIYGKDQRLAFFNTAFADLWQLEHDWLASQPTLDEVLERLRERRRLPEQSDFRAFKAQQRAMFTSLIEPQQELLHLPDQRTLRFAVSPHPFGGLVFVYEDVTDRLALERSYNTSIAVQRETLNNLYEGIAVFGNDGRLKLWNPAYARLWRLSPEDLVGEPHISGLVEKFRAFYPGTEPWNETRKRIVARITAHNPASTRLERVDGSVLQAVTVPLPDGNVLSSYLDITDSTRVEQALRERTEALEAAGRLKSEFIANVSYELRTPLNAIAGFAEILANQYFGTLNPRQMEYSRHILDSTTHLSALINDILDLATLEAGYLELETCGVDIHALMSGVMNLARERARVRGLHLEFDCPADIGSLTGDEKRLKHALFNLVSNALKFTPSGGTVSLRARREKDGIALVVSDTGIGVAPEDQRRIFDKFERGSGRESRQAGAGLGLALVKSFIELHGGSVQLKSRPGAGTTVTCHIPAESGRAALSAAGE
jgi:signal transduction histidine kinase